jgi:hypothetical protein
MGNYSSSSIAALAAALSKAQSAMGGPKKEKVNPQFKSLYATVDAVKEAARNSLAPHGLSFVQLPVTDEPGYAALSTMLMHSSGEWITTTCRVKIAKDDPQGWGSALTYLERRMLMSVIGMAAEDDDDGAAASGAPHTSVRGVGPGTGATVQGYRPGQSR